ncbi:MAG: hypothetical protein IPF53_14585 [Blastocatellia bacterium]|nr:hypothetical protein [Blastocatellia bacterium]
MTMIRSVAGIFPEIAFSSDVLPVPVPPETIRFFSDGHDDLDVFAHVVGEGSALDETLQGEALFREPPDRDAQPLLRTARENDVDAGTVREPAVEPGGIGGDALVGELRDVAGGGFEGAFVREDGVGASHEPCPLDVDVGRTVDHDFGDRRVLEVLVDRLQKPGNGGLEDLVPLHHPSPFTLLTLSTLVAALGPDNYLFR